MQILKGVVKNPRGPRWAGKKLTLQSSGSVFDWIVVVPRVLVLVVDSSVVVALGVDVMILMVLPCCAQRLSNYEL